MILKGIILSLAGCCICFFIHIVVSFLGKGRDKGESLIYGLIRQARILIIIWNVFLIFYTTLFFITPDKITQIVEKAVIIAEPISFMYGIFLYVMLSFIYLTIYYLMDRSVSSTLLEIIDCSAPKKLTGEEIMKIYNVEQKYLTELKGMIEGKFIIKEGQYYKNSFKGMIYAKLARIVKYVLKLGQGG